MSYYLNEQRKSKEEEEESKLKIQALIGNPELYRKVYVEEALIEEGEDTDAAGDQVFTVDDIDDLQDFLESIAKPIQLNSSMDDGEGWL